MLITNHWPNPLATASGRQPNLLLDGTIAWRWSDTDGFGLNPLAAATIGPFAQWDLTGLPGGAPMVMYAEIVGGTAGNLRGPIMEVATTTGSIIAAMPSGYPASRYNTLEFTCPSDGGIRMKLRGSDSQVVVFYNVYVMTAADANAMKALGLTGFAGDTMPLD